MTIYIINVLLVLLFSAIYSSKIKVSSNHKIEGKKVYAVIVFSLFASIMAFRATSVGVDTAPYSRIYGIIGSSESLFDAFDRAPLSAPAYVTLCWILNKISPDPQLLTITSSLIISIGLFSFIEKASDDMVISCNCWIGLTMLYASMNGNRQFMAVVLVLNAFLYLSENLKSKIGWILILLAISFHSTAFFSLFALLGLFLVKKIKRKRNVFIVSVIISVIISFGFKSILPFAIRFVPRYEIYTSGTSSYNILVSSGGGRIILLYLFLFAITFLWLANDRKGDIEKDNFNSKIFPAVVFCSVFGIFNAKNELINRMLWFYISLFITFIPSTVKKYHGISRKIITYGVVGALYMYSFISLIENQNGVVPYMFFWE